MNRLANELAESLKKAGRLLARVFDSAVTAVKTVVVDVEHAFNAVVHSIQQATIAAVKAIHQAITAVQHAAVAVALLPVHLVQGIGRAITHFTNNVARGTRRVIDQIGNTFVQVVQGLRDLVFQLGRDIVAAFKAVGRGIMVLVMVPVDVVRSTWRVLSSLALKVGAPIITPVRRIFAQKAKEEVLGVATTPDHKLHWELLALIIGLVVIIGGGLLVATQQTALIPTPHLGIRQFISKLTLQNIATKLSTFTPSQLLFVLAGGTVFAAGVWFWIRMVRDTLLRNFESNTERTKWRTITLMLFIPGAVAYFVKVYNRWSLRQFAAHHFVAVMVTGVAVLVACSTYGTLSYFNGKAEAGARDSNPNRTPNLEVDPTTKNALLGRTEYGTPLSADSAGGRVDPFAPVPGLQAANPVPTATPTPSATPAPRP